MPVIVRGKEVAAEQAGPGAIAQSLLSPANTGSNNVLLDLITFEGKAAFELAMNDDTFGWVQVLDGSGSLTGHDPELNPARRHLFAAGLCRYVQRSAARTAPVCWWQPCPRPGAVRSLTSPETPSQVQTTDWSREPVLQSEHDARTRIYLATRTLTGTSAYRGEMIRYTPGTEAPEPITMKGLNTFQYVLRGNCTAGAGRRDGQTRRRRRALQLRNGSSFLRQRQRRRVRLR